MPLTIIKNSPISYAKCISYKHKTFDELYNISIYIELFSKY